MDAGLLSLKWNNHNCTFLSALDNLRKKELYSDATLACEGKFFSVHKLVLSTCSDFFRDLFEETQCKSPVVVLKDIKHRQLECLLDYMYLGEVDVRQADLADLIKAAECLQVKGLAVPDEDPLVKTSAKRSSSKAGCQGSPSAKRISNDFKFNNDTLELNSSLISVQTIKLEEAEEDDDGCMDDGYFEQKHSLSQYNESVANERDYSMKHIAIGSQYPAGCLDMSNEQPLSSTHNILPPYDDENLHQLRRRSVWGSSEYGCMTCGKTFPTKTSLQIHARMHTGERPYSCTRCNYRATQKMCVERHFVKRHAQYCVKCSECAMLFSDQDRLDLHTYKKHSSPFQATASSPTDKHF